MKKSLFLPFVLWVGLCLGQSLTAQDSAAPGTIAAAAHPALTKVLAAAAKLGVKDDEFALFYYREDGKYNTKSVWLWRYPDGDGQKNFDKTQNIQVIDGVGYLKFKLDGSNLGEQPIMGPVGEIGFIVRGYDSWDGQSKDFIWNLKTKGNQVVYFDGESEVGPVAPYKPLIKGAQAAGSPNQIKLTLSGKFGLDTKAGSSGFFVKAADGSAEIKVIEAVNAANGDKKKNFADTVTLTLASDLPLGSAWTVGHPAFFAAEKIDTSALVTLIADKLTPAEDYELGPVYDAKAKSVEFRLWAPTASKVIARLWDKSWAADKTAQPFTTLPLTFNAKNGVWTATFKDRDPDGLFYDYLVTTNKGERACIDPFAKSMDAATNSASNRSAIINLASAAAQPEGGWQKATDIVLKKRTDAVIYEVSVRDFTISADSGVPEDLKGTFLGFTKKLDYLKALGVTHVQLLPAYNFGNNDETKKKFEDTGKTTGSNYNWGYDPVNWFTPEGWYSTNPGDPYSRVRELKTLVREAHKAGLGVILDVVYNHMGNPAFYDDIVPNYFFRKTATGAMSNQTGVGNDFNSSALMARRLIVDSLVNWVKEYNVDGFRFDLMGLIDSETVLKAYAKTSAFPDKADILFQGEGWKMYSGPSLPGGPLDQNFMTKTNSVAVFNDEVRNLIKAGGLQEKGNAYVTKKAVSLDQLFKNLTGRPQKNYKADDAGDSMLYVAAHDNLDLHDAIAFNAKLDHKSEAGRKEIAARVKLANFLILTGQGIVFLHGGQEKLRTKPNVKNLKPETLGPFVRNSYDSADNINQVVWTLDETAQNVQTFTQGLINLRKATPAFRQNDLNAIQDATELVEQDGEFSFSYTLKDGKDKWFILTNAATGSAEFKFDDNLAKALVIADQNTVDAAGLKAPQGVKIDGNKVTLDGLTACLIKLKN